LARRTTEGAKAVDDVPVAPFVLPVRVRQAMVDHARRDHPLECCGLLVGRGRRVTAAVPMRNLEASRTRFRLDDREHIALRRSLRLVSPPLEVIGLYHSHPDGPSRPSPRDIAEAHYPGWVHVIIGGAPSTPRVRGFAIEGARARPLRLCTALPDGRAR
jgi:proteasome lid subunit RPN8/RPN11